MSQTPENTNKCEVHIVADNMPALMQALLAVLVQANEYSLQKVGPKARQAIGKAQVTTQFGAAFVLAQQPLVVTPNATYYEG